MSSEEVLVHFGPQHPGFGPYELVVKIRGDEIVEVDPIIGFVHRGLEKLMENRRWIQNIPLADRLCFLDPTFGSIPYVLAMENLLGWKVPERALYLRTLAAELSRMINHLTWFAMIAGATGLSTPGMWSWRERERILYLAELLTGGRFAWNYIYPGGVRYDLPKGFAEEVSRQFRKVRKGLKEFRSMLFGNSTFVKRTSGVGVLTREMAYRYGVTGPNLRASGEALDLRKNRPYLAYDRVDFDVVVEDGGDAYSRALVRYREIYESMKIVEQLLRDLPEGDFNRVKKYSQYLALTVPAGEAYAASESARGIVEVYLVSIGGFKPYRVKLRSPSLAVIQLLRELLRGVKVADLPVIAASFDYCPGDADR